MKRFDMWLELPSYYADEELVILPYVTKRDLNEQYQGRIFQVSFVVLGKSQQPVHCLLSAT